MPFPISVSIQLKNKAIEVELFVSQVRLLGCTLLLAVLLGIFSFTVNI